MIVMKVELLKGYWGDFGRERERERERENLSSNQKFIIICACAYISCFRDYAACLRVLDKETKNIYLIHKKKM